MARKKQIELTVAELIGLYRAWHKHHYRFDPDCHGGITMGLHKALLEAYPKGVILVPGKLEHLGTGIAPCNFPVGIADQE